MIDLNQFVRTRPRTSQTGEDISPTTCPKCGCILWHDFKSPRSYYCKYKDCNWRTTI